jgi:hypothetical protein
MMRNLIKYLLATMIMLFIYLMPTQAEITTYDGSSAITEINLAETSVLMQRIEFIKDMDKSNLTSSEKSELRTEVKAIHNELKQRGPYLYISAGALILILVLVLLLR